MTVGVERRECGEMGHVAVGEVFVLVVLVVRLNTVED